MALPVDAVVRVAVVAEDVEVVMVVLLAVVLSETAMAARSVAATPSATAMARVIASRVRVCQMWRTISRSPF